MKTAYLPPGGESWYGSNRHDGSWSFTPLSSVPVTTMRGRTTAAQDFSVSPCCPLPGGERRRKAFGIASAKLLAFAPFATSTVAPATSSR